MNHHQIERWTLSIIDSVSQKRVVEDARVELKSVLPR